MGYQFNNRLMRSEGYQIATLQNKYQSLVNSGKMVINCTIGDPKDDTPSQIQHALINTLTKQSFSQYPSYIGCNELRCAIAQSLNADYAIDLNENEHIISCNGTKEAIYSIPPLFDWSSNQLMLIPSLSYPVYALSAQYHGIKTSSLKLTIDHNFLPDLSNIPEETLANTQLFWINSPHNPTTSIAPKRYLSQLIDLAHEYNFIICSDECYNDLYYDDKPTSIMEFESDHWVCFRSLSKRSHMTGYRSGAIITKNSTLMQQLKKLRSPMGVGTPSFIQAAAIEAWKDTDHTIKHRNQYKQKRDQLISILRNQGMQVFGAQGGFYLWVSHSDHETSQSLANWFLDRNILVTPGTTFGDDGNPYVRMVYCIKDEDIQACSRLLNQ